MLLLAVARDGASRSGLLCAVVMFMCVVIGCVQGRRQSQWTVVSSGDFMCVVIGCVQGRRQSLWTAVCRRLRARAVEGGAGGGRLPRRPTRPHQSAPARHGHGRYLHLACGSVDGIA